MDLELFVTRVKRDRNWTEQAALAQWNTFKQDESLKRDNLGPKNFPLRLEIPAWVFGDEGTQMAEGDFEEKKVTVMSRAASANTDALRQMRSEMYHGFAKTDQPDLADVSAAMKMNLPMGSLTLEDWDAKAKKENHIAALLEAHAPDVAAKSSYQAAPPGVPAPVGSSSAGSGALAPSAPEVQPVAIAASPGIAAAAATATPTSAGGPACITAEDHIPV